MERLIHDLVQGADAWHQFRLEHRGASEASAMLGISRKVKRNELLRAKKTGIAKEFGDWVQRNILDYGHEVEAMARPIVERMIGETLYPTTFSFGKLSASCDGITMSGEIAFEHKQWNAEYGAMVADGDVPEEHMPQCQQVLCVTGAERLLFVVSDGTEENFASVWVYPDAEYQARIVAGWKQFDADLAAYVPTEEVAAPAAVPVEILPSLVINVTGSLAVSDNLKKFGAALQDFIGRTPKKPESDDEFAVCEAAIKTLTRAEEALDSAEAAALAQVACIDEMRLLKGTLRDLARSNRLALEKLVKAEKENRRLAIVQKAQQDLAAFRSSLPWWDLTISNADFAGAIKGLKTMASIQNAVDTELARAKIESTGQSEKIAANMATIDAHPEHAALFADRRTLALKDAEFVALTVKQRIANHEAAEAQKVERIRAEEQAKAEKAAADKLANEQREAAQASAANDARELAAAVKDLAAPNIAPEPANIPQPAANNADNGDRINLGYINTRLGVVAVTRDSLSLLGFEPVSNGRPAILYRACDFPAICRAIAAHVMAAAEQV